MPRTPGATASAPQWSGIKTGGRCAPEYSISPMCPIARISTRDFMSIKALRSWSIAMARGSGGRIVLTLYDSRGRMGLLDTALAQAQLAHTIPDIAAGREYRSRLGAHRIRAGTVAPSRSFRPHRQSRRQCRSLRVHRYRPIGRGGTLPERNLLASRARHCGACGTMDNISAVRQRFLNAGGLGILVGDGQLPHPGPEQIIETYYNAQLFSHAQLSFDYQWIDHPAYNRDRGPASVYAVRFHAQF